MRALLFALALVLVPALVAAKMLAPIVWDQGHGASVAACTANITGSGTATANITGTATALANLTCQ